MLLVRHQPSCDRVFVILSDLWGSGKTTLGRRLGS